VPPSDDPNRKIYSDVLTGRNGELHKLMVKSKQPLPPEPIKQILKTSINPTEVKVGINTLMAFKDGRVLIESSGNTEMEILNTHIRSKCGEELEMSIPKLRNPRLVIHNIPDDITAENAERKTLDQNPELNLNAGELLAKYCYLMKNNRRNLVIEVSSQVRRELLQTKIKLGWLICKAHDYIVVKKCFKCSGFNHRIRECRCEETFPLSAGRQKKKDCSASPSHHKCINCMNYNKYNRKKKICENHSSLGKNYPSIQVVLAKYIQNTDY
jgi:hypothetical protein